MESRSPECARCCRRWWWRSALLALLVLATGTAAPAEPPSNAWPFDADLPSWVPPLLPSVYRVEVLPAGLLYPAYLAGPKESRLATQLTFEADDGWLVESTLGGRFGVLRTWGVDGRSVFQLDVEGSVQLRQDPGVDVDLRSADFRVGVPFTWTSGASQWKLAYYHISSHLGDEFLIKNPGFSRLNYVRDSVVLGHSWFARPDLRLYGEVGYAFYTDVAEPWEVQFGAEWAPAGPTGLRGAPFAACNALLREEVDFGGTLTVEAGWAWRSDAPAGRLLRMGVLYQGGKSTQYSFVNTSEQQIGAGLWYDF